MRWPPPMRSLSHAGAAILRCGHVAADVSIANVQRKINPGLRVKGILLTMTEHTNVSDHYCGQVRSTYGSKIYVFTTEIPRNVKVQESQANAEPTIL